ncbi:hypothetical protein DSO57_1026553 [Entomophthora muscae]|uniref:Uncharacterized protein n=1 Tax=Entomophthora muscae TaxID=34485 RepID=A0ACC2SRA6_9FUNG|nr:hypothetical protein DSO57_1026553 [Entomophthora muscae]
MTTPPSQSLAMAQDTLWGLVTRNTTQFFNTSNMIPNFKPVNFPKFDRKSNVTMFLRLYENTIYGADEAMKSSAIFNCLDFETQTTIMPRLLERGCTFANVSKALLDEFGSEEALNIWKISVEGGIRKGETMQEFANRFYLEAQTLISLKAASSLMLSLPCSMQYNLTRISCLL